MWEGFDEQGRKSVILHVTKYIALKVLYKSVYDNYKQNRELEV